VQNATLARPVLEALAAVFAASRHRIHVTCDPSLQLPAAELGPVGTIVNEAISNSIRHAFPEGRDGDIWVRLAESGDRMTLVIRDNGVGMPDSTGDHDAGRSLIEALARQLGGYARLGSANFGGAEVSVVFRTTSGARASVRHKQRNGQSVQHVAAHPAEH
jgi:two-component sensor histidine kinase